jgi:hypothetical protein
MQGTIVQACHSTRLWVDCMWAFGKRRGKVKPVSRVRLYMHVVYVKQRTVVMIVRMAGFALLILAYQLTVVHIACCSVRINRCGPATFSCRQKPLPFPSAPQYIRL